MAIPLFAVAMAGLVVTSATGAVPTASDVSIAGPEGPLAGTMTGPARPRATAIIIPGSGPTDRDGNNPMGVRAGYLRQLAEGLAARQVATIRIDKRGMFGSKGAIVNANAVTIADYAGDVRQWAAFARKTTKARCVWLIGHSEGALVALAAAQGARDICGVVSLAGMGRPMGAVIRAQLQANPANAPVFADAERALSTLENGQTIDVSAMHPALRQLFAPAVQPYLINVLKHDPAGLAKSLKQPLLIVQGEKDMQVSRADAEALKAAAPKSELVWLPNATHVLKDSAGSDRAANMATYSDASLPLAKGLADAVADFITANR